MKLYGDVTNDVDLNNINNIQDFHIEEPHKVISVILDNAYSNPTEAMVREICQNASEVDENFTVHLPTDLEPWFSVIDNGTGMSPEDCYRYASGVGASTKDSDNNKVGGFGIGMKVPFTVSDQYLVISRWNGKMYTFNAFKDEHGLPRFVQLNEAETDEVNGLEVRVPIESHQFSTTKRALLKMLEYFKHKPSTNIAVEWPFTEYSIKGEGYGMVSKRNQNAESWRGHQSRVIMGNLWYDLDAGEIRETYNDDYDWLIEAGIDLFMDIGSIQLPLSREGILYTPATIALIRSKLDAVAVELVTKMQVELDAQPNIYAAMKFMANSGKLMERRSKQVYMYKGQEAHGTMLFSDIPSTSVYEVGPSRFRLKSLNLQNCKLSKQPGMEDIRIGWSKHDLLLLMYDPTESKRIPSRLLRHVQEGYDDEDIPRVFLFTYDSATKAKVKSWIYTTFGITPTLFEDTIDEYKTVKGSSSTRKKVAKVKVLNTLTGEWDDADGDLDLDNNSGVYVDLRRGVPYGSKYSLVPPCFPDNRRWDYMPNPRNRINRISTLLKKFGLIPEGGSLYGCPGSYKNKLIDHPNYIHLDDAVNTVLEEAKSMFSVAERTRLNYLESLKSFVKSNDAIFDLDINVKGSYYNSYKDRITAYKDTILNSPSIETYYLSKELSSIIRADDYFETYKNYEEEIETKFSTKYPILQACNFRRSRYNDDDGDQKTMLLADLQEYVQFKTTNPNI